VQTTNQTDIGLDLTVLGGRLTFYADYYYKLTKDMLMTITLPAGSAAARDLRYNGGEIENKGFEFSVSSRPISVWFVVSHVSIECQTTTKHCKIKTNICLVCSLHTKPSKFTAKHRWN
jgi:outer membrane receptor protein involved in Fe transport